MKVRDIMNSSVVTCGESESLHDAAQRMWDHDIGALPVTDGSGKVVGVITDRDVCMAALTTGAPLRSLGVASAMAHTVFTCGPEDPVYDVESLMRAHQVRRVPVIDGQGSPIGMIALNDLVRHADSGRWQGREGHELIHTLAAISQPRRAQAGVALA